MSETIEEMCKTAGITHRLSSAYHSQTNRLVERFNRTLVEALAKTAAQHENQWDIFLFATLMAYRTTVHSTTKYTPFFLTHGREATMPIEVEEAYLEEEINEQNY